MSRRTSPVGFAVNLVSTVLAVFAVVSAPLESGSDGGGADVKFDLY